MTKYSTTLRFVVANSYYSHVVRYYATCTCGWRSEQHTGESYKDIVAAIREEIAAHSNSCDFACWALLNDEPINTYRFNTEDM